MSNAAVFITFRLQIGVRIKKEFNSSDDEKWLFLLDAEDNIYCLEANTLPGMTSASLLPQEAKAAGIEYGELCELIIKKSLERYNA